MYRVGKEELAAVKRVIDAKMFFKANTTIQETTNAEREMREKFGSAHVLTMTSGHAALTSALIGMGIGPGDQVIVPAYTYIATAMAVVAAGAIPVIAEVDESLTLSPEDFENKITKYTKAVIPVHIQGFPSDMDRICEIAKKHGIFVLEDACQADGASYHGKRLGTIGDAGAFSFNYYKIISCGEGGALLTDNKDIFERAIIYHDSSAIAFFGKQLEGIETKTFCGQEFRTNEIASAILREQLLKLDTIIADLRANKKYLMDNLAYCAKFIKSNDIEGDLGTTLALSFDSAEKAKSFSEAVCGADMRPINTGKHIYSNWDAIMNKRGAFHPLMDPFKMEANLSITPEYTKDMCPKTLDLLARTVYISINPDWTEEERESMLNSIKAAL